MMNIDIGAKLPDGRVISTLTLKERIEEWFKSHELSHDQAARCECMRVLGKYLAEAIEQQVPNCADKMAAIRLLRECVMTANAAIATNGV